jgi:hypothetical protein
MDAVQGGGHAHDLSVDQGDGQMMPWICEELRTPPGIHDTVEDARRDVREQGPVTGVEDPNLYRQRALSSCRLTIAHHPRRLGGTGTVGACAG